MWLILLNSAIARELDFPCIDSACFPSVPFIAGHDMDLPVQHIAIGDAVGGMTIIKVTK